MRDKKCFDVNKLNFPLLQSYEELPIWFELLLVISSKTLNQTAFYLCMNKKFVLRVVRVGDTVEDNNLIAFQLHLCYAILSHSNFF